MGCMCTRDCKKDVNQSNENSEKTYSWDKRRENNFNYKDFTIEDLDNEEVIRSPESVSGQQFIIQNCKSSTVYILDHMNTITVDDCTNCNIILGPVQGSVFLRNCDNCVCVAACGQFRTRDCRKLHLFLYSATQPIIEASTGIIFCNYQLQYKNIIEHLTKANLSILNKNWEAIYDFTPVEGETNWSVKEDIKVMDYIKEPLSNDVMSELIKWEQNWKPLQQNSRNKIMEPMMVLETTI